MIEAVAFVPESDTSKIYHPWCVFDVLKPNDMTYRLERKHIKNGSNPVCSHCGKNILNGGR